MPTQKRRVMAKKELVFGTHTYELSYEFVNVQHSKTILFLHGWGSNKEIMKQAFSQTFPHYKHLYIDLPGFGLSSVNEPIATEDYASIVKAFLQELGLTPLMIVGHSFGGKVATLLMPETLVLLSSAGVLAPKSFNVKCKIVLFKLLKPFFPLSFYRFFATKDVDGMSSVMYEILKKVVNEDFTEHFQKCTSKAYLFWGKEDKATPLFCGEKMHSLIKGSYFFPLDGDHFFFLKQAKTIEKTLLEFGF